MTYKCFEDLPVWQASIRLAEMAEDFLQEAGSKISRGKQDQLDRCSLSVSNNIAEPRHLAWCRDRPRLSLCPKGAAPWRRGMHQRFERGTTKELLAFLYIARGSSGEVRSMMRFFERRPALKDFTHQISNLIALAEACSRQIRAWADSLQNSDIEGQRHLNDDSRKTYAKKKQIEAQAEKSAEWRREAAMKLADGHPFKESARREGLL